MVNLDKLTYAGNPANLASVSSDRRYKFVQGDICDRGFVADLLLTSRPRAIVHFAAESHVDRSIHGPDDFVRTNVNGTFSLLEEARGYWSAMTADEKSDSASCMFPLTKFMARSPRPRQHFRKPRAMLPIALLGFQGGF